MMLSKENIIHKAPGWILLIVSFAIGYATLLWGSFSDEADNLVLGDFILRGYQLYTNLFTHHFPFAYYWTAMVFGLFGKSILAARLSLLIFQWVAFAFGMLATRRYLTIGLAALLWSIVRVFYLGNLVLYNAFAASALLVIFLITYLVLTFDSVSNQNPTPKWVLWLAYGVFSIISILSDPLSIYAIAISFLFLFLKTKNLAFKSAGVILTGLLLYAGFLFTAGSLSAFWESAILFNSQVYAKYVYANPVRISDFARMVFSGLEITNKVWYNAQPFKPITTDLGDLDRWLFTGFLYRFAVLSAAVYLAARRKYLAALFLYLFAAATLVVDKWGFRGQPFVMLAWLVIAAWLTLREQSETVNRYLKIARLILGAAILVLVAWAGYRLSTELITNPRAIRGESLLLTEELARNLNELTCQKPKVQLAYYPDPYYAHWFTGMRPISKYTYMYPWVAEVGLEEVIDELARPDILAIVIRYDTILWDYFDSREYLRLLDEFLADHYIQVDKHIFFSPALHKRCPR